METIDDIIFEELSEYGDLMTIEEFIDCCKSGYFIDYDGDGRLATKDKMQKPQLIGDSYEKCIVKPSNIKEGRIFPEWATHIMWFNK